MPIKTRSQARAEQTSDLVASSRAKTPRKVHKSQQVPRSDGKPKGTPRRVLRAGVSDRHTVNGGKSSILAGGSMHPAGSRKCRSDCMTCPDLVIPSEQEFTSNVTGRNYKIINNTDKKINCKLQNYVYLLTCKSCNVQYVGESVIPLHKRMNIHRRGKSGCEISINHYKNVCPGSSFTIQIIEVLPGNGYKNGAFDIDMNKYRKEREEYWIKTLRTVYPYGLCEKITRKGIAEDAPIGRLYPPLSRHGERLSGLDTRTRNGSRNNRDSISVSDLLEHENVKEKSNHCRKLLDKLNKKILKKIKIEATELFLTATDDRLRWYELILDIINSKFYIEKEIKPSKKAPKYILPLKFKNKGLDAINLSKILHRDHLVNLLPETLQSEENFPSVVYSLESTIRNKIFNYKQTVADIDIDDRAKYNNTLSNCDCKTSKFCDSTHKHIITGDLRIITNTKLRKLISRGPNYREPRTINWKHCQKEIETGIELYINKVCLANKTLNKSHLALWKLKLIEDVNNHINKIKQKFQSKKSNPTLKDPFVIEYLENLHKQFVLVPIDKAANNVAIVCKHYYVEVILKEIGILGKGNQTYEMSQEAKEGFIDETNVFARKLGYKIEEDFKELPSMYWIPKMHKTPIKHRFIVASKKCCTKPISTAVSNAFKLIFRQTKNFHLKSKFEQNYNKFWVVENADPIINALNEINKKGTAKDISTFDFSTLYTNIPHDKLLERLDRLVDFAFKGGDKNYINISWKGYAYWGKKTNSSQGFSQNSLKNAINYLITNCYFNVGKITMKQVIGIPMGIDPAPFWANLFLYTYELDYMNTLIKEDKCKARHFHSTVRFIDDLAAINDGGLFGESYSQIYPEELELKIENQGTSASFLCLHINIENGIFVYKLYDKRDDFPFSIVRMPYKSSNIPSKIFYSSLVGEFLRIARSTSRLIDFIPKANTLIVRMIKQGEVKSNKHGMKSISKNLLKIINRHPESFSQFSIDPDSLVSICINNLNNFTINMN